MIKTVKDFKEFMKNQVRNEITIESPKWYLGNINIEGKVFNILCPCKQLRRVERASSTNLVTEVLKIIPDNYNDMDEYFEGITEHILSEVKFHEGVSEERKEEVLGKFRTQLETLRDNFSIDNYSWIHLQYPNRSDFNFESDGVWINDTKFFINSEEVK